MGTAAAHCFCVRSRLHFLRLLMDDQESRKGKRRRLCGAGGNVFQSFLRDSSVYNDECAMTTNNTNPGMETNCRRLQWGKVCRKERELSSSCHLTQINKTNARLDGSDVVVVIVVCAFRDRFGSQINHRTIALGARNTAFCLCSGALFVRKELCKPVIW